MSGLFSFFKHYACDRELSRMANGECSLGRSDPVGDLGRTAVKAKRGTAARTADHLDFQPVHAPADSGSQRFGGGLFGGKTGGKALGRIAFPQAILLLSRSENPIKKARSEPVHRFLDSTDLNHIDSGSHDHDAYEVTTWSGTVHDHGCGRCTEAGHLIVALRNTDRGPVSSSDTESVKQGIPLPATPRTSPIPWAIEIRAVSMVEPGQLVRTLTGAILGCGGWVLSRGTNDTGGVKLLFEFERRSCLDIYSVLVATGVELNQVGHIRFTELCQCTRLRHQECSNEIASIDLEIQTFALGVGNEVYESLDRSR